MNEYYVRQVATQEKEIETIKERTISLKLSDADCERIARKAGLGGITVSQLLQNFIGDLVDGTYSNGSDERYRAEQWYERCWFSWVNEDSLLHYLLDWGHDVDDFLTVYDELKNFEANPLEYSEEVEELEEGEKLWFEEEYQDYIGEYLEKNKEEQKEVDLEKEIDLCREWLKDLEQLKGNYHDNKYYESLNYFEDQFEKGTDPTKLMNGMEEIFRIPMINDKQYNQKYQEVIELYRKISDSRKF